MALSFQLSAEELPHDPTACPDLTGSFVYRDDVFGDWGIQVESKTEADGVQSLTITMDSDGSQDYIRLDGIKQDVGDGWESLALCYKQAVVLYEYENKNKFRFSKMKLDETRNIVLDIDDIEGKATAVFERR